MKYTVECKRSGSGWAITVPELKGVFSQAHRLDQVESMAREAISLMLEVAPDSFDVEIKPLLTDQVLNDRIRAALSQLDGSPKSAVSLLTGVSVD